MKGKEIKFMVNMKKIIICLFVFGKIMAFAEEKSNDYSFPLFFAYYEVSIN